MTFYPFHGCYLASNQATSPVPTPCYQKTINWGFYQHLDKPQQS